MQGQEKIILKEDVFSHTTKTRCYGEKGKSVYLVSDQSELKSGGVVVVRLVNSIQPPFSVKFDQLIINIDDENQSI